MATEISIPSLHWTGTIYDSQIVALEQSMSALSEVLSARRSRLKELNPSLPDDELDTTLNIEFVKDLFAGSDLELSSLVAEIITTAFPDIRSRLFLFLDDFPERRILFKMDALSFLEIFSAINNSVDSLRENASSEAAKPAKTIASKKSKSFEKAKKPLPKELEVEMKAIADRPSNALIDALEADLEAAGDREQAAIDEFMEKDEELRQAIVEEDVRKRKIAELRRQLDALSEAPVPTEVI